MRMDPKLNNLKFMQMEYPRWPPVAVTKNIISMKMTISQQSFTTEVIPKPLPVLSTERVLPKAAVDRGLRFSTEQYGCRQRNDFINALKVRCFSEYFYIFGAQTVSELVCYCLSDLDVWL